MAQSPTCQGSGHFAGEWRRTARRWPGCAPGSPTRANQGRLRALADQGTDDPAIALLDAWAVVTDVVSFYSERIAQEGFLRTAVEAASVRQEARTLGYELRPGVAAQAELVFTVETASGTPDPVIVPAGTPVQTTPTPGGLPQTFETSADLEARAAWNAIPAVSTTGQPLGRGLAYLWLPTTNSGVRVGDWILVFLAEKTGWVGAPPGVRVLYGVTAVDLTPNNNESRDAFSVAGWTRLRFGPVISSSDQNDQKSWPGGTFAYRFTKRLNLFGWNAPDQRLLTPAGSASTPAGDPLPLKDTDTSIDVDGDQPDIAMNSWLVLEHALAAPGDEATLGETPTAQPAAACYIANAAPSGTSEFGLSGRVTRVAVSTDQPLSQFDRRQTLVHAVAEELPAHLMPQLNPVGASEDGPGSTLEVVATDPPIPIGRRVAVTGITDHGADATEVTTVVAVSTDGTQLTLDPPLVHSYQPATVRVRGNVVAATHGETVQQVLGSGDGRVAFQSFALRRPPLTYVRSTTSATGAQAALEVRVDDVAWSELPALSDAGPHDRAYIVRQDDNDNTTVTFGDGTHGSRLPTGNENVVATYRVGIGADGAAEPDQIRMLVRKPRGIASVTNLAPSHDWAPLEDLEQARVNAPQRIRTLDRAVSVVDYEDFARGYAGVGRACADLVWDGRVDTVVLSVLAATGDPASDSLLDDLRDTIDAARELRAARVVMSGEVVDAGADLRITVDPHYRAGDVLAAVTAALLSAFGGMDLAAPLAASAVLVRTAEVPGVVSVTMPLLSAPALPGADGALLAPAPARWGVPDDEPGAPPRLLPAQALRMVPALLRVAVNP